VLPEPGPLAEDLGAAGVEVLFHPLGVIRRSLATPRGAAALAAAGSRAALALTRVIRKRRIALVHSNTSVVLSAAAAAGLARVPHVWHVREIYSRYGRAWPLHRRVLGSASAIVCVSRATAAQFPVAARNVHVIHDGLALTPSRAARSEARETLGIAADHPAVALLGRISDWKGQDVLVRALAEPALRERGVIALLAGDAWPGAEVRLQRVLAVAERLGVRARVRQLGFRDDVESVYGAADVVAVPSTQPDPLPNAALEAAAAGCAVVASGHGGLPEIIRDGITGLLVTPGDPAALAAGVARLLDDPSLRERLGAAAGADVRQRFAGGKLLTQVQALYDALLAPR
jgi:glycosyltransferase involved in cell wall biosynthesis